MVQCPFLFFPVLDVAKPIGWIRDLCIVQYDGENAIVEIAVLGDLDEFVAAIGGLEVFLADDENDAFACANLVHKWLDEAFEA